MTDTYDPTSLFAGDFPIVTRAVNLRSGQGVLPRGTVLGQVHQDESDNPGEAEFIKSAFAASDGSQTPKCILAHETDTTTAVQAPAYFTGEFAAQKLTYGAGHTWQTVDDAFIAAGAPLFVKYLG